MFMIFLSQFAIANAQGIFQYDRVDFFQEKEVQEEFIQIETKQLPETIIDEWAEPIISPSGRVSTYVPPKEVRDFLEKPDPQNAKAYLAWNLKRIKKFILAQELLRKEAKELEIMKESKSLLEPSSSASIKGSIANTRVGVNYLFYFMLKGCSLCEKQAKVIEDIYLNHLEIKIEAFAKGFSDEELQGFGFPVRQDNGIAQAFKIKSYPAILVFSKNKQRYLLSGYTDKHKILGMFE